jgi:hypothetical protein
MKYIKMLFMPQTLILLRQKKKKIFRKKIIINYNYIYL